MTLEEATERLASSLKLNTILISTKDKKALSLSIEALKRTSTRRETLSWKFEPLLPGETE